MIRNLKALGLALVAVFALGAISASAASAVTEPIAHFVPLEGGAQYKGSWHVTGTQIGKHIFKPELGEITCEEAHFLSHDAVGATTSLKATPKYEKCHTKTPFVKEPDPTTVTTNGCWYTFTVHNKGTTGKEEPATVEGTIETHGVKHEKAITHTWSGDLHLECPVGVKGIEIHVYANAQKHKEDIADCTYTVAPQTIGKIDYSVHTVLEGGKYVSKFSTVHATESEVKVKRTKGGFVPCGAEEQNAKYTGTTTVQATTDKGVALDQTIEKVVT